MYWLKEQRSLEIMCLLESLVVSDLMRSFNWQAVLLKERQIIPVTTLEHDSIALNRKEPAASQIQGVFPFKDYNISRLMDQVWHAGHLRRCELAPKTSREWHPFAARASASAAKIRRFSIGNLFLGLSGPGIPSVAYFVLAAKWRQYV